MIFSPMVNSMRLFLAVGLILCVSVAAQAQAPVEDNRPLSPAQTAIFETPHLRGITAPETLQYQFVQDGGTNYTDQVAVHILKVNPDGSKSLAFDYLTGERQVRFPELDHFRGNPLVMLTLERDAAEMKEALGLSSSYFRNKIREAFVTGATMADTSVMLNGVTVPAREITIQPFLGNARLERIPSVQAKSYTFVLADAIPGMIAEIRISVPADAKMDSPAFSQRTIFTGVSP